MAKGARIEKRDLGWTEFLRRAREIKDWRVKVGVLEDGAGGEREEGSDLTVAEVAAINEFGTEDGHIPERSFIRSTFDRHREEYVELGQELIERVLDGRMTVERALGLLGARAAADVKATITAGVPPPNAESTVRKKMGVHAQRTPKNLGQALAQVGRAAAVKTLIDTGRMLNAVGWSVAKGGREE